MTAPEELAERPAPEASAAPERAPHRGPASPPPRVVRWAAGAAAVALVGLWLVVRPAAPHGAEAVVELLLAPAVLFAEARLLAGRSMISAAGFAVLFGLGAVLATVAALLLEWPAQHLLSATALDSFGAFVETLAPAVPVVVVAVLLLRAARRPAVADLALAGLASGLGFLVVQTSLVTATSHVAPRPVHPLVAGWQRMPAAGGADPAWFVGPGVATALLGLAVGAAIRWQTKPWRLVPPLLALGLVGLDRAVFDRQLRHVAAGEAPAASGLVHVIRVLTLSGRLELVLLVLGLVLAGRGDRLWGIAAGARRRPHPQDGGEDGRPAAGDGPPAVSPPPGGDRADAGGSPTPTEVPTRAAAGAAGLAGPPAGDGDADAGGPPHRPPAPGVAGLAGDLAVSLAAGALFVALARTGHLGLLRQRPVALAVAVAGFLYSLLRLAALRSSVVLPPPRADRRTRQVRGPGAIDLDEEAAAPTEGGGHDLLDGEQAVVGADQLDPGRAAAVATPSDEGRQLLCAAAVAASVLGIASFLLPTPAVAAAPPVHGGLVLDAVRGWVAQVGRLGLLLGIAGFAAPPGPVRPATAGGWRDLRPGRLRASGSWRGLAPRSFRVGWSELWRLGPGGGGGGVGRSGFWRLKRAGGGPGGERLGWRGFWRMRSTPVGAGPRGKRAGGRLPWRSGPWRPEPAPDEPEAEGPTTTTITIEPVPDSAASRDEYEGATVQEAMQAALGHLELGLAGTSLQLVDEGLPPKPGKPGSGRPARVRVTRSRPEADPLRPPGRASISRATPVAVVVELVDVVVASAAPVDGVQGAASPATRSPTHIEVTLANPVHASDARTITCHREEQSPGRARYRSNPYTVDGGEDPTWFPGTTAPAKGIRVGDGEQLRAGFDGQEAVATVYDGWARLVIGINKSLFDLTAAHHVTVLADVEAGTGPSETAQLLRDSLEAVEEGRRLLASAAPDDEKAFLSTALLHHALTLAPRDPRMLETGAAALRRWRNDHRVEAGAGLPSAYRELLESTAVGRLWVADATSVDETDEILGWSRAIIR